MSTLTLSDTIKCNLWRTVEVPNIIVYSSYYCKIENILDKLNPSSTYPFYGTQFSSQIDWEASSCQTEVILNGEYDSSKLYDLSELLINHCRNVIPLDKLNVTITEAEFISRFKTWNERTSTSPSGLHLGHYKALIGKHSLALDTLAGTRPWKPNGNR